MPDALLVKTLVVIVASIGAVGLFAWMRLPPVLGYLLAGLIIGPHGIQILAGSSETEFLAELGVIFLMFMAGLEFSIPAMLEARRDVLGGGGLQVGLTTLMVAAVALLFSFDVTAALILGGAVAMSSTALTVKQTSSQGELASRYGGIIVGILLFQDLATLPFLVAIGTWTEGEPAGSSYVALQFLIAAIALAGTTVVGRPLFRTVLTVVARLKSNELFLLVALAMALGTAFVVNLAGLAPAIGAFLAGMLVGESDFRHQIEDDVQPFRDVLVGLFFITVGMAIDPAIAIAAPFAVAAWLLIFVPGKGLILSVVGLIMRWPLNVSARVAVILAHGGEFGLLLLTQAMHSGILDTSVGQPVLLALAVTMGLAPIFIQHNATISRLFVKGPQDLQDSVEEDIARGTSRHLRDHVLLCGCGRTGRLVAMTLEAAKVPYIAIELDGQQFKLAKEEGCNVVFGDATRKRLLEAAGLARARVIASTFDHHRALKRLLRYASEENPQAVPVVSVTDYRNVSAVAGLGVDVIFPENLAAGLGFADQVLVVCGLSRDAAAEIVAAVRSKLTAEASLALGIQSQ